MADNKQRKTVLVTLEGTEYKMKFTLLSLAKLEKEGINIADLGERMSMEAVMKVLWAGLSTFKPELTADEVGSMIDVADLPMVTEKLNEAFGGIQKKK